MSTVRRPPKRHPLPSARRPPKGQQLETLFGQDRTFCYSIPPAFLLNPSSNDPSQQQRQDDDDEIGIWEQKWRFQAEILRAECKFLRMEREVSAKRLERERAFMERTLKSALHALVSAHRKIEEGESASSVLKDEIQELKKKLKEIQNKGSSSSKTTKVVRRDPELLNEIRAAHKEDNTTTTTSFDNGGETLLQRQLLRIGGFPAHPHHSSKDLRDIAKASLFKHGSQQEPVVKECVSSSANEPCNSLDDEGKLSSAENVCAGHCKALVRRIMEQVRAETEQWSQMQHMLGQVRQEMEELQASRNFWEDQALDSDYKIKSLNKNVQEWKQKASFLEAKEKQLEDLVQMLQQKLGREKQAQRLHEKGNKALTCRVKGNGLADENCMKTRDTLLHDVKKATRKGGAKFTSPSRLPFMDIGNLSPLVRQNSRRSVFPLQSPPH